MEQTNINCRPNILLAITKLIFAIWIWYKHNFFIIYNVNESESTANLCVSFFFICSGYYLYNSAITYIKNHDGERHVEIKYIWNRLKKMGLPLLICYLVSFANTFVTKEYNTGFMHFLWYIHIMIIFEFLTLILLRRVSKKTYTIINIILIVIATSIYYVMGEENIPSEIRCFIFMSIGYMLSLIKLPEKKSFFYLIPYIVFLSIASNIASCKIELKYDIIFQFIVFPLLFLSSIMVPLYSSNYVYFFISKLSLLIYISQSITRLVDSVVTYTNKEYFYITLLCIIIFMLYENIIYFISKRKMTYIIEKHTI